MPVLATPRRQARRTPWRLAAAAVTAVLTMLVGLLATAAPASAVDLRPADPTAAWPDADGTSLPMGVAAQVTVTLGLGATSNTVAFGYQDPDYPWELAETLATGTVTPQNPTLVLPLPTARRTAGPRRLALLEVGDPESPDVVGEWTFQVLGHASAVQATLPQGAVRRGRTATITGKVTGSEAAGRTVVVEALGTNGTWVPLGQSTSAGDGSFSMQAPTWWVAKQTLRARVTPSLVSEGAATANTGTIRVDRDYRPRGSGRFKILGPSGARWDPCAPIRYSTYAQIAWPGAAADLQYALGQVSAATGLRFVAAGSFRGLHATRRDASDFKIVWTTPKQQRALSGSTLGLGGSAYNSSGLRYDGHVDIDAKQKLQGSKAAVRRLRRALLMHEIGHAIGLAHVDDRSSLMNPVLPHGTQARWGVGDLRGLARLGAAQGCVTDG